MTSWPWLFAAFTGPTPLPKDIASSKNKDENSVTQRVRQSRKARRRQTPPVNLALIMPLPLIQ